MSQHAFAAALLDPGLPPPAGLTGPDGAAAPRRFAVYRNNVTHGLIRVLAAGFPVVEKLVGPQFFSAMAVEFIRAHPPRDRRLMLYGADFPGFLHGFPPVAALGYLPDVARLEQALRESYHAADAPALPAATLAALPPDRLAMVRLQIAAATRLVVSPWPIHAIWRANSTGGPPPVMCAETVAVFRKGFDPDPVLLPPGGGAVLAALMASQPLGAASLRGGPAFDLAAFLALLLNAQAITGVEP